MVDKLSGFSSDRKSGPILCGAPEEVKMAKLKFSLQPQASAHICVQCLKEVLNFRSGNEGYENVSNCQSPRGHPPWWGTETIKGIDSFFT